MMNYDWTREAKRRLCRVLAELESIESQSVETPTQTLHIYTLGRINGSLLSLSITKIPGAELPPSKLLICGPWCKGGLIGMGRGPVTFLGRYTLDRLGTYWSSSLGPVKLRGIGTAHCGLDPADWVLFALVLILLLENSNRLAIGLLVRLLQPVWHDCHINYGLRVISLLVSLFDARHKNKWVQVEILAREANERKTKWVCPDWSQIRCLDTI